MRKTTLSVTLFLIVVAGWAQDSSYLNIGYLSLRRAFTQTITVKGTDLEKMPFANLSDAIAGWFFGAARARGG